MGIDGVNANGVRITGGRTDACRNGDQTPPVKLGAKAWYGELRGGATVDPLALRLEHVEPQATILYLPVTTRNVDPRLKTTWEAHGKALPIDTRSTQPEKPLYAIFGDKEAAEITKPGTHFWIAQRDQAGNISDPTLVEMERHREFYHRENLVLPTGTQQFGIDVLCDVAFAFLPYTDTTDPMFSPDGMEVRLEENKLKLSIAPNGAESNIAMQLTNGRTGETVDGWTNALGEGVIEIAMNNGDPIRAQLSDGINDTTIFEFTNFYEDKDCTTAPGNP